jgi:hypothetical protein
MGERSIMKRPVALLVASLWTLLVLPALAAHRPVPCVPAGTSVVLTTDPGLHLLVRLEEASGTRVDSSPKGNHLTAVNTPTNSADHQEGGFSLNLTEASLQYLERPSSALAPGFPGNTGSANTAVSVGGWVKMKAAGNQPLVFKWGTPNGQKAWTIWLWNFGAGPVVDPNICDVDSCPPNGAVDFRGTTVLQLNQWYHFVYTFEGASQTSRVYVNGVLDAGPFAEGVGSFPGGAGQVRLGRREVNVCGAGNPCEYADVLLDEVFVLDRVLSAAEAASVYQFGIVTPSAFCDDGALCTIDECDPTTGCTHTPVPDCCSTDAECDDHDACTGSETCDVATGACRPGTPLDCADADACTVDDCEAVAGCVPQPIPGCCNTDTDCADADPCTIVDRCNVAAHVCEHELRACADADVCDGEEVCDPATGDCAAGTPLDCDDRNVCTNDACDRAQGCTRTPVEGCCRADADCDDHDVCTGTESCVVATGACEAGAPRECDDQNACTADSCVAVLGCVHADDSAACDDGNVCTVDGCQPSDGCVRTPVPGCCTSAADCLDQDVCNGEEACVDFTCRSGVAPPCDDENPCTDDRCDPARGCLYVANTVACSDGDPCTHPDACRDSGCVGTPLDCDDENPCTDDGCIAGGCLHAPNTAPCDDGDPTTTGERCADGVCVAPTTTTSSSSTSTTTSTSSTSTTLQALAPVADTYIESGKDAKRIHGTCNQLKVGLSPARITYLKFDLRGVAGPVAKATLRVVCTRSSEDGGTILPVASSSWTEGTRCKSEGAGLKWNDVDCNRDGRVDANDASCSPYVPVLSQPVAAFGRVNCRAGGAVVEKDVTAAFQGGARLYTLAIVSGSTDGAEYHSQQRPVAAQQPRLYLLAGE